MQYQSFKFVSVAGLLATAPAAWAHPGLLDGNALANLIHLLTEPDHLLILAGIGLTAGILWHIKRRV
jgi:hydrogenase/urease accessory protein HupE